MSDSDIARTLSYRLGPAAAAGARQRMKDNKEATIRNFEIVDRLRAIREELVGMKLALDEFTYEDVESLKENIQGLK